MSHNGKKHIISDIDLEKAVSEAMKSAGWIFPQTPEEVLRAEKVVSDDPAALPRELSDPDAVLRSPSKKLYFYHSYNADVSVEENLARAAREGGAIPPHILEQMHKDRKDAERKSNE